MNSYKAFRATVILMIVCVLSWQSAAFGQQRRSTNQDSPVPDPTERDRKRDEWQRPTEVLDGLGLKSGQRVADIGSGSGYFTFHLAARVGTDGKVYAVDIDDAALKKLRARQEQAKLPQIETILSQSADPRLPNDLDAVLIVDSYHEFREYAQTMQSVLKALKPGGRLVLIDGEGPAGSPRTDYHRMHVIPADLVREEIVRAGFVFKESRPGFYDEEYGKKMYFLIFEKPAAPSGQTGDELAIGAIAFRQKAENFYALANLTATPAKVVAYRTTDVTSTAAGQRSAG